MKQIPLDSKILSISHNDLDGAVSQIILGHVYKNIRYIHCSFYKIDDILLSLEFEKYDYVFLTDIHPDKKENLYLSPKIIVIDHHKSAESYHDPSKGHFIIDSGKCAAVLVKAFVEKMYNIKLESLNSLVHLTNDYDMWILNNPKSKLINDVMFYLYRPAKFRELFFDGRTKLTQYELEWLRKRRVEFKQLYESLSVYEFEKINGCITESPEFINEICHKLMNEEKYQIVFVRNPKNQRVSVRHNIKDLDIGNILKSYGWGGGHMESAGFFTTDNDDFKMKVTTLEDIIHKFVTLGASTCKVIDKEKVNV